MTFSSNETSNREQTKMPIDAGSRREMSCASSSKAIKRVLIAATISSALKSCSVYLKDESDYCHGIDIERLFFHSEVSPPLDRISYWILGVGKGNEIQRSRLILILYGRTRYGFDEIRK